MRTNGRLVMVFSVAMTLALACAADRTPIPEEPPMLETILSIEKAAMERWRNGDPLVWVEISAPEVSYVDPGLAKPIEGIEEYRKYLAQFIDKIHYQVSEFIDPKLALHGELAVLTYNYRSTQKNPDGSIAEQILWNTTEVYARVKGGWRIVHTHWSYVGHAAPSRVEVPVPVERTPAAYQGTLGELMALEAAAMKRWRSGDPSGFLEISAPEVTYFGSDTVSRLNGRAALEGEYAKIRGKVEYAVQDFVEPKAQVYGDAAVLSYRFLSTRLQGDGSVARRTAWNCTEVYARRDGQWRIVHTHWSLIGGETK
jgi:uncharacterized protein (TIGR02246 family)